MHFIGTILVRADNDEINTVEDLKDKIIAGQDFSVFSAAQAQFWVMQQHDLNPVMGPKQVIFTGTSVISCNTVPYLVTW